MKYSEIKIRFCGIAGDGIVASGKQYLQRRDQRHGQIFRYDQIFDIKAV
jgi:hypothetical protein